MSTVDSFYLALYFWDISMPLLESMLLSSLLTPVEIGPSNASPGYQRKKERNGTNKKYDTRQDLNPGPSTYRADALPTDSFISCSTN